MEKSSASRQWTKKNGRNEMSGVLDTSNAHYSIPFITSVVNIVTSCIVYFL